MAQVVGNAIRIDGLNALQRDLRRLSPAIKKEFNREMKAISAEVVSDVRSQMPHKTGNAAASVRPVFASGYLAIRAGGSRAPYYPWLDFGGAGVVGWKGTTHGRYRKKDKRPFIKEGRWIYPTIARVRPEVVRKAQAAIARARRLANL